MVEYVKTTPKRLKIRKGSEWGLAFRDIPASAYDTLAQYIPVKCRSNVFPSIDLSRGSMSFEGFLSTVMIEGNEYSIGDITFMMSTLLCNNLYPQEMVACALTRLLAWGVIEYTNGYKDFKRTSKKLSGIMETTEFAETQLITPEGDDVLYVYNTQGDEILFLDKDYADEIKSGSDLQEVLGALGRLLSRSFSY